MAEILIKGAGVVLRALREKHSFGLNEMARLLGWDPSRLSLYETNKRAFGLEEINAFCTALKERPNFVILQITKTIAIHPEGEMLQELDETGAKVSMILCSNLENSEQSRLEKLDDKVFGILVERTNNRFFWVGRNSSEGRSIELTGVDGVASVLTPEQVSKMGEKELLAEIKRQVANFHEKKEALRIRNGHSAYRKPLK